MNHLAHALLSGPDAHWRVGGLMGDFLKGPLPAATAHLPPRIAHGVTLHRRIDAYADTHPAFRASCARVGPLRRRYAGIMVDMFYDHLLASAWEDFADTPLREFAADTYAQLHVHAQWLPARLAAILPHMQTDDWLTSYGSIDDTGLAIDRIARHRLRRANPLAGAIEELHADRAGFQADFQAFMADVIPFAAAYRQACEPDGTHKPR